MAAICRRRKNPCANAMRTDDSAAARISYAVDSPTTVGVIAEIGMMMGADPKTSLSVSLEWIGGQVGGIQRMKTAATREKRRTA